jgi:hypothetical protein
MASIQDLTVCLACRSTATQLVSQDGPSLVRFHIKLSVCGEENISIEDGGSKRMMMKLA